jgi:hypothetical protein
MNAMTINSGAVFGLLPAFTVGIYDGLNPCNFGTALIFLMYLSAIGHTLRQVVWFGFLFLVSSGAMQFLMSLGTFDRILTLPPTLQAICRWYGIVAVIFLFLGVVNILDWWRYKQHGDIGKFRSPLPGFLKGVHHQKKAGVITQILRNALLVPITMAIASGVTFASAIYPQREYIFILYSYMLAGGNASFALWSFFQYSLASVLPLVLIWAAAFLTGLKGRGHPSVIAYYKGISAALFLSIGIGLGYFVLSNYFVRG